MKKLIMISKIISNIFSPLINSTIAFALLIFFSRNISYSLKYLLFFLACMFSTLLPILYVFVMHKIGEVKQFDIIDRLERLNPLIFGIFSYSIGFILLSLFDAPSLVTGLMFCYATNTFLVYLITRQWKVSIHTTGVGGPLVALTYFFGKIILPFYVLILIVGGSRLILKRHTIGQVLVGMFIGLLVTTVQLELLFV